MNKKALVVFGGAIVVAVVIILIIVSTSGSGTPSALRQMRVTANSFPVPGGTQVAFPDAGVKSPASYTKGWRDSEAIDAACTTWRNAYRNWVGDQATGQLNGEYDQGQSCSYSAPKDGFTAALQVEIYGSDPKPQVTLTIRNKS